MNSFFQHLPWRVASLAGLMVGAISLATGVEIWVCLLRVGGAFLLFGAFGLGLRSVLQQSSLVAPPKAVPKTTHTADHRGQRFDQTTPAEDPSDPDSMTSSDANEIS